MSIEIVEIIDRSEQGITRPFICRGEDGFVYFVKGRGAGHRSLICEWVAGQLALRLGLPVAPFGLVHISEELLTVAMRDDRNDLGAGLAFGSRKLSVVELTVSHLEHVPDETQRDVLVFDWWVCNSDRTLTEAGGNPNLFWNIDEGRLVVIDHNQAFDPSCAPHEFVGVHAFWGQSHELLRDCVIQQDYSARFEKVMKDWADICNTVPLEWRFFDVQQTMPTDFDFDAVKRMLMRCWDDEFWSLK
ncbi:MAG: HipA family kinase [Halothiobacillaceae bacterium]